MVDDFEDGKFGYKNKDGNIEHIELVGDDCVVLYDNDDEQMSCILIDDIPKMIKALQAAYDYSKKMKE